MQVGATPKCQAALSGAGAQTCSGRGVRKAERCRAAGRRNGPEAVTEQETEWNRGDRHQNDPICLLPGDAVHGQPRSTSAAESRSNEPQLALAIDRLLFGTATLRSAQYARDSVPYAASKDAVDSRVTDSHLPILNSRRCRRGSSIDFLSLEALLRVAIAVHSNQLAHPASAHGIALAMENEIDGFAGL